MRQKKSSKKPILIFLLILILIPAGIFLYGYNWYNNATGTIKNNELTYYEVTEGSSFQSVMKDFESKNIIHSSLAVQIYTKLESVNPQIKIGKYQIPTGITLEELIKMLELGTPPDGRFITIKEGLRYEEIGKNINSELSGFLNFNEITFGHIVENPDSYTFSSEIATFLNTHKPAGKSLRGFLYPDTYRLEADMSELQIIEMMLKNFKEKIEANYGSQISFTNPGGVSTLYQGLILASVIEKEASAWDDRKEISSVFHNRLSIGMALQSDATVNFVTGNNKAGVEIHETKIDNPYNTYMYPGLMPTPINNPRISSIIAALEPANTDFYFFYHTPQGKTFFNVSFAEHNVGVCRDLGC